MTQRRPAIILVPGISSVASLVYEPLIAKLKTIGFDEVVPINLPSIDTIETKVSLKPTPLEADTKAIRSELERLVKQDGREVVVVAHSYGGTPALCSCEGLWKSQRGGEAGGVIRACLMSSSLSLPGQTVAGVRAEWATNNPNGGINDGGAKMESVGDEMFIIPEGFQYVWFKDLPAEEVEKWGTTLKPSALGALLTPVPQTGIDPKSWKISYLVTKVNDPGMPEAFQKFLIEKGRESGAQIDSIEIESGHFVQVSHVEEVAKWISNVTA